MIRTKCHRKLLRIGALLAWVLAALPASAQPFTFTPLGPPGLVPDRQVLLRAKDGPFSVITGQFGLPGGSSLDWHSNPGVAVITVTEGMFNEHHSDGCISLYEPGDVFFESEGQVHKIVNPSATGTAKALITFIVPVGSDLITFVPPPRERPCAPGHDDEPDEEEAASLAEIQSALAANAAATSKLQELLIRVARSLSLNP